MPNIPTTPSIPNLPSNPLTNNPYINLDQPFIPQQQPNAPDYTSTYAPQTTPTTDPNANYNNNSSGGGSGYIPPTIYGTDQQQNNSTSDKMDYTSLILYGGIAIVAIMLL